VLDLAKGKGLQHQHVYNVGKSIQKKTIERNRIYRIGLKFALESCMSALLGAQQGEQALHKCNTIVAQSIIDLLLEVGNVNQEK
jgi:hypothetical protein